MWFRIERGIGIYNMSVLKIDYDRRKNELLPSFSITIDGSHSAAIYSDMDMQVNLVEALQNDRMIIFDQQEGLYERLSVEANIKFYHRWFNCKTPLTEILVMFHLQYCAKKPLYKCSLSEVRRVYFAKYYMTQVKQKIFQEPIHGVDVLTINTFMMMLEKLTEQKIPVLVLLTNLEHALLLADATYKLREKGINLIEVDEEDHTLIEEQTSEPSLTNLFKISAKVDDKVILFDPLEIDYIESQDGKSKIVINNESFLMDSTLAAIEKKLEVYGFFRCHRSYIVNLQKVREIITWSKNTYSLKIDNQIESTIPLSRSKIQDIQDIFNLK